MNSLRNVHKITWTLHLSPQPTQKRREPAITNVFYARPRVFYLDLPLGKKFGMVCGALNEE